MIANSSPGVFRYGHVFQRGDLPIFISDSVGSPLDPYSVKYALYYQPKDSQCLRRAGPCGRTPVQADVGEYYATGCAGECGQPGQWFVRWCIQEYFEGPLASQDFGFVVFNTAEYCPSSGSTSCSGSRCQWDCNDCNDCNHRESW